jgi:hypothetical protein
MRKMDVGYSLDGLLNKTINMKLFKHPVTGLITIWHQELLFSRQYLYYSKREAARLFKKEYGLRGKVVEVDWCLWSF